MNDNDIYKKILAIIKEHSSYPNGITKTELTRIYSERFGTSKTTIWEYMRDLIDSGKIELRKTKKQQHALFIPKSQLELEKKVSENQRTMM